MTAQVRTYARKAAAGQVEAVQVNTLDYDGLCEIVAWCGGEAVDVRDAVIAVPASRGRRMFAADRDFIVKGPTGLFTVLGPVTFQSLYREAVPA